MEPDSTLSILLSGVVGAMIGGLVTVLGVWLAIRHERALARDERLTDSCVRLAVSVGHLTAANSSAIPGALRSAAIEVVGQVAETQALSKRSDRAFANCLSELRSEFISQVGTFDQIGDTLRGNGLFVADCLHTAATDWLADSTAFRRGRTCQAVVNATEVEWGI